MLSWLITLLRQGKHIILENVYNTRHKRRWLIIENAFGIFIKKTFCELHGKIKFNITIVPYLITCVILHNLFLGHHEIDVECILNLLQNKNMLFKDDHKSQKAINK
jgi:hypothetical protein